MIGCITDFFKKHKKKFIFFGVVVGGAVIGSRYAKHKFIEWQEKETKEFLERTKKQHFFETTEKNCNQTIISLSMTLKGNILSFLNIEEVTEKLKGNPSNKIELWQELKVLVFTKATLLIYSGTLLTMALRIQLNIIGGHIFCSSSMPDSKGASDIQERYLSQCYYFLDNGVKELHALVQEKVQSALNDITLKQNLTLQHLENIFWSIQSSIDNDVNNPIRNMPALLYGNGYRGEDTIIQNMMSDTVDLQRNQEVMNIASSCVSRGFSNLVDFISESFLPPDNRLSIPGTSKQADAVMQFAHPNTVSKPLAKVIPIINSFGKSITSSEAPEVWIAPVIYMDTLKLLGANIYESYSCQNGFLKH